MKLKQIFLNSAYNVISWLIPIIMTIITIPVISAYLGTDVYGVYIVMSTILSFTSLLNFGTGEAVIKKISSINHEENIEEANKIMNSSLILNVVTSIIFLGAIVVISNIFLNKFIKVKDVTDYSDIKKLLYILALSTIINFVTNNYISFFKAIQKYSIPSIISTIVNLAQNIGIIVVLHLGYGLNGMILVILLTSIFFFIVSLIIFKSSFKNYKFSFHLDKEMTREIFGFSKYSFLVSIFGTILFNSDKLFLGYFWTTAIVTYYAVPANLTMKVQQFVATSLHITFPLTSNLVAESKTEDMIKVFTRSLKLVTMFVVSICIPAIIYSDKLMFFWLGQEYAAASSQVTEVLFLAYGLLCFSVIPYYFFYGMNLPRKNFIYSMISGTVNLIFNILLIPKYGAIGAAVATLLGTFINFVALSETRKLVKVKSSAIFRQVYFPIGIAGVIQLVITFVMRYFIHNLYEVMAIGFVSLVSFYLIYILLHLYDDYEKGIFLKIKSRIVRSK